MGRFARRARRREDGAAAVEFALVLPIFLLLVFGIIQYGLYFWAMQAGTSAVGEATRRMTVGDCQTAAELQSLIEGRLGNASTTTAASDITIVTRSYTKADGTTSTSAPGEIGGTVKLEASYQSLDFNFPLIPVPNNGIVTRSATARIEDVTASPGGCS